MKVRSRSGEHWTLVGPYCCAAAVLCTAAVEAADRPPTITPLADHKPLFGEVADGKHDSGMGGVATGPGIDAAAAHVIGMQCPNGGWNWPHGGCGTTFSNITAPICLGLLEAYATTGDPAMLTAAIAGANHDLTFVFADSGDTRFGSFAPGFFHTLSGVSGNPTWSNNAATDFFDKLSAGTYGDPAVDATYFPADTYEWIARLEAARSGGLINLRPWDLHNLAWVAGQIGNPDSSGVDGVSQQNTFHDAILSNLDVMDAIAPGVNPAYFGELIGLAGAVRGLALNGTTSFPPIDAPLYPAIDGIDTLCELADALASFQNANGSWYWTSNVATASDEDSQTTAYAVLALMAAREAGCGSFGDDIAEGRAWLRSMQDVDGGFLSYPGGDHNIEVESEALWAVGAAQSLSLEVAQSCFTASPITVQVWARDLQDSVSGYQAFIKFDASTLAYDAAGSSYNNAVFDTHFQSILTANVSAGEIRIDGNTGFGDDPYTPGSTDLLLATLSFTVVQECNDNSVEFDLDEGFDSEFSVAGEVLPTTLSDSDEFYADLTDPVISCPDIIVVSADAGGCTAELDPPIPAPTIIGGLADVQDAGSPHGNVVSLCSNLTNGDFSFASHTLAPPFTFASLVTLSADYNPQAGCWGCGSPRFSIRIDHDNNGIISAGDKNVFVYFGTPPGLADCETIGTWVNTGNFVTDAALRWDSTQVGGPFYGTYANAAALVGPKLVLRVSLVTDGGNGGCGSGGHCLLVDNLQVNSEVLSFNDTFIASDSCTTPVITGVRSDDLALDAAYPSGTTTITWTATDSCGNASSCEQTVTVNAVNDVNVVVQLPGSSDDSDVVMLGIQPPQRCIRFVTDECGNETNVTLTFTDHDSNPGTPIQASAVIQVGCGPEVWTFLCAKDEQHTKWSTSPLTIVGVQYTATSSLSLAPGDTDNDGDVDIHDVTWLLFQFGFPFEDGDCPWDGTRDADFTNNGAVGSDDYALLSDVWLTTSSCACTAPSVEPIVSVHVNELHPLVANTVDRNRDGTFDHKDVRQFEIEHGLPHTLSRKMTSKQ